MESKPPEGTVPHNMIPPRDPDGWKRNFNSFMLIGQSIVLALALFGFIAAGITWYNKTTSSWDEISKLLTKMDSEQVEQNARLAALEASTTDLVRWREIREMDVKERRAVYESKIAALETGVKGLDERLDKQENDSGRLSDKQSATDARLSENTQAVRDLQKSINEQGGDIKVIRAYIDEERSHKKENPKR